MIIFVIILFALVLWKSRLYLGLGYSNSDLFNRALDRDSTDSVKGIFILYVFLCHVTGYIPYEVLSEGCLNYYFLKFTSYTRQLLVVMFLFYSGYGVMEAIKRKGKIYINSIPKKRFLTTLLNFDIAVALFIVLDLLSNVPITLNQSLLAFTGWTSVGNSNWYIFCILFLYIATFLVFKIINYPPLALFCLIILTVFYIGIVQFYRGSWWVDTTMAYPVGVAFSIYKKKFERIFTTYYWQSLSVCVIMFLIFYNLPIRAFYITANLYAVFFAFLIVLLTMRWHMWNPVLHWCGVHLFPLYIYQRLPMIFFSTICSGVLPSTQPYVFVTLSLVLALMITYLHKYIDINSLFHKSIQLK